MSRTFYSIPTAFILLFPYVLGQCTNRTAIDITDGQVFHDGTITKDGVRFPPKHTFKQKSIEGTVKTFGCLCEVATCFRKCCPLGSVINSTTYRCIESAEHDNITNAGLQVWYKNLNVVKTVDLKAKTGEIGLRFGRPVCDKGLFVEEEVGVYFQEVSLTIRWCFKLPTAKTVPTVGNRSIYPDLFLLSKEIDWWVG